jgi:rfaE bifunctional protein kinase chain/domain
VVVVAKVWERPSSAAPSSSRIVSPVAGPSPEAPVPVLEVRAHDWTLGGAANAAANLQALGGATTLIGVVGADDTAEILGAQLAQRGIANRTVADPSRPTSKKTRLVAQQQQIVRVDHEQRNPVSGQVVEGVKRAIDARIRDVHAVVLSDYAKGVVTAEVGDDHDTGVAVLLINLVEQLLLGCAFHDDALYSAAMRTVEAGSILLTGP